LLRECFALADRSKNAIAEQIWPSLARTGQLDSRRVRRRMLEHTLLLNLHETLHLSTISSVLYTSQLINGGIGWKLCNVMLRLFVCGMPEHIVHQRMNFLYCGVIVHTVDSESTALIVTHAKHEIHLIEFAGM